MRKGGDDVETDFAQLYEAHFMQVYSYVLALSKSQDLAEEITQKTFFQALTARRPYCGGSSERTWLCAIAKRLFFDECRRRKKRGELPEDEALAPPDPAAGLEDALTEEDTAFRLHQALHALEEPYKEVFQLRVFGELSFQKIGALFDKTENWARVTYHRARLKLQERMEEA